MAFYKSIAITFAAGLLTFCYSFNLIPSELLKTRFFSNLSNLETRRPLPISAIFDSREFKKCQLTLYIFTMKDVDLQGSCLVPLLFLFPNSDLPCTARNSATSMFADDVILLLRS